MIAESRQRIFLLSPAHCGGKRAALLFREDAAFALAARLRQPPGVAIGEVFSFISGLYFRGKLAYTAAFARAPADVPSALVITGGRGLMLPEEPITLDDVARFCEVPVDLAHPAYRDPLMADLEKLSARLPAACDVVLLGSLATPKYLHPLVAVLGERVCFPEVFIGMGDMQRGALMLRAAVAGEELAYARASGEPLRRGR